MDDVMEEYPEDNQVRRKAHCWMIVVRGSQRMARKLKVRALAVGAFHSLPHKNDLLDNFYSELELKGQQEPKRAFHDDITHSLDRELDSLKEVVFEQVQLQSAMTVAGLRMRKLLDSLKAKVEEEEKVLGIRGAQEPAEPARVASKRNSMVPNQVSRAMSSIGRFNGRQSTASNIESEDQ
mmetsp:Transcript_13181/g.29836  ORF Transcript_13181/g.29836 Transcript_13181/m.29836 type:complete len:180 (+) Transcript_13181:3-542(+)